jgi:hypothetical protein
LPNVALLHLALAAPVSVMAGYQTVLAVDCAGTTLQIDARPFGQNEAGGSSVALRYRYRDQTLNAVNYERYYKNLAVYLPDAPQARVFGLNLALDGLAHFGATTESGDSLYLSQDSFTRAEFVSFGDCIASHESDIRAAFLHTTIRSKTLLGLMRTESGLGLHGIARVIYAQSPIKALYQGGGYIFVVQTDGQVWLRSNFTANNVAEAVQLGSWTGSEQTKAVLELKSRVQFQGQAFDVATLKSLISAHGSLAKQDFVWRLR